MDIDQACRTLREWNVLLDREEPSRRCPGSLGDAVAELKRFLETETRNQGPIAELAVSAEALATPERMLWVMRLVESAELIQRSRRIMRSEVDRIESLKVLIAQTTKRCVDLERALGSMIGLGADEGRTEDALSSARKLLRLYTVQLVRLETPKR